MVGFCCTQEDVYQRCSSAALWPWREWLMLLKEMRAKCWSGLKTLMFLQLMESEALTLYAFWFDSFIRRSVLHIGSNQFAKGLRPISSVTDGLSVRVMRLTTPLLLSHRVMVIRQGLWGEPRHMGLPRQVRYLLTPAHTSLVSVHFQWGSGDRDRANKGVWFSFFLVIPSR
ncbi:uncharacterized protein LOC128853236 isoform X7 [Cuculus canorus]|uniref:uncharacterized protein LOC128853236 isoform X7 n=1 Tax=Cuculus canorus TaxID=55661 RepID=UPI0023AB2ACC|nr:uncharacterized protein LOC128853236 isoform X7 [Cuculus canorus]